MNTAVATVALTVGCIGGMVGQADASAAEAGSLTIPWNTTSFSADEGCQWQHADWVPESLRSNAHYLAGPKQGEDWRLWFKRLQAYREGVRNHFHDSADARILLRFDGVRAWVRTDRRWAFAAGWAPGENLVLRGQARAVEGNNTLCLALDWCDRNGDSEGPWRDWSTVLASTSVARDGGWHDFEIATRIPAFEASKRWARPILGMDGTFDRRPGSMLLRNVTLSVPQSPARQKRMASLKEKLPRSPRLDDSIYRRHDLAWMAGNFVCGFVFVYDRSFWDPERRRYCADSLAAEARREFGGFDSVVLWHAYPRIGADERNQFDFFRDMPDGLPGVRGAVRDFHRQGVKVFLPYNPWDTGTAREKESDDQALARAVADVEADGIFLDTMIAAPLGLRQAVDARRPGVAFEPEGHPAIGEIEICSGSWAQWLEEFPEIGVLHLKWLQPRHIQHQIRRWDKSHQHELAAAWLNGSGVLVWENIFGVWNPWNGEDRAALRRMAPVLRTFAPVLTEGEWLPFFPTLVDKAHASCWQLKSVRLWTIVNQAASLASGPVLEIEDRGETFYDLWRGERLESERVGGKIRVRCALDRYGAILAVKEDRPKSEPLTGKSRVESRESVEGNALSPVPLTLALSRRERGPDGSGPSDSHAASGQAIPLNPTIPQMGLPLAGLLESQRRQSRRVDSAADKGPHLAVRSVIEPKPAPAPTDGAACDKRGMLKVAPATSASVVRHMRRECGCYPDPGTPPPAWEKFLSGTPHDGTIEHHVTASVGPCWIDAKPVTNAQFAAFLKAAGYAPTCRDRFLHHWGGQECPPALRDKPVVYVDLDDARAYAAWAKKRLPSEWEWHQAAKEHGRAFDHTEVFEWTESERDDGHTRFVMLRGGCRWQAQGSIWYFPGGPQPIESHAKFLRLDAGLDRCSTIGFRCVAME